MKIRSMTATFGCLDHAALELKEGLNLLEMPNESGKSTWCAFLRAMLYGLESRKGGSLSERNRYTPWSGAPMEGTLELVWQGRAITLRRFPKGSNPFGGFQAVYTGTEEAVPGLTADNAGETLLGVTKEVFQRTCFIPQGGLWVESSGDLERRVAALAAAGEEDVSFSDAEGRLRDWRNARQANKATGSLPRLRAQLETLDQRRQRARQARERARDTAAQLEDLEAGRQAVQADLDRHAALQSRDYRARYQAAEKDLEQARARYAALSHKAAPSGALTTPEALREAQGELAYHAALEKRRQELALQVRRAEQEAEEAGREAQDPRYEGLSGDRAVAQAQTLEGQLTALHRLHFSHWVPLLACALAALIFLVVGLVTGAIHTAILLGVGGGLFMAGAAVSFSLSAAGHAKERRRHQAVLDRYGVTAPQELVPQAKGYARRQAQAQELAQRAQAARSALEDLDGEAEALVQKLAAFCAPFAPQARTPQTIAAALEEALAQEDTLAQSRRELAAAQAVFAAASAQGEPEEAPETLEEPVHSLQEDQAELRRVRAEIAGLRDLLARSQGEEQGLGDLAALEEEAMALQGRIAREEGELQALNLALEALTAANAQLQTRFSPLLNAKAGELLSRLTGGRYTALAFTRQFQTLAQADAGLRSAQLLSQGTADQAYLALRLAICLLALPDRDPAPLVLDDALVTFDDRRLKLALEVLGELARERQLLVFTCQGRERAALG